jgi:hypothetical protein
LEYTVGGTIVVRIFAWLLAAACLASGVAVADENPVLVFDAASLTNVIDDLSKAFTEKTQRLPRALRWPGRSKPVRLRMCSSARTSSGWTTWIRRNC